MGMQKIFAPKSD